MRALIARETFHFPPTMTTYNRGEKITKPEDVLAIESSAWAGHVTPISEPDPVITAVEDAAPKKTR